MFGNATENLMFSRFFLLISYKKKIRFYNYFQLAKVKKERIWNYVTK